MALIWRATAPIWFPDQQTGHLAYAKGDHVPDENVVAHDYAARGLVEHVVAEIVVDPAPAWGAAAPETSGPR